VGAGAFGSVWKVTDLATGQVRAAKILHEADDSNLAKKFFHEYALLFRLRHPGLIQTHDYGRLDDGRPFFTMSWLDGQNLDQVVLSSDQRLRVIWELVDCLTFVHRQGLIHADIKPDNMKIDMSRLNTDWKPGGERALTLLDFGLTLDRQSAEDQNRRGTVHYMAPEWFTEGDVDHRVDLYSLGVVLFHLYAGHPPFEGDEPLRIVQQHLEAEAPSLKAAAREAPSDMVEITARLLAKQPEIRDKGSNLLTSFLSRETGLQPGSGHVAVEHHRQTLGRYARMIPLELLDTWLTDTGTRSILYIRGGQGLEQERVLEALSPDICRYGCGTMAVSDPEDSRLDLDSELQRKNVAMIVVTSETAAALTDDVQAWLKRRGAPGHLALALNADLAPQHELAHELARLSRHEDAHTISLRGLEDGAAHHLLTQATGDRLGISTRQKIVELAQGNPDRLFALVHDALDQEPTGQPGLAIGPSFSRLRARETQQIQESFSAEDRLAMAILATARTAVDRTVLRALADLSWSSVMSRWLALGFIATEAGRVIWQRPDLADTLVESLSDDRRQIVHRAWTEYWGSFSPDPGSEEHEYLVHHALRSDAHRRAVRVGLEAARYWNDHHQAHKALEVLEQTARSLSQIPAPPPAWVFEQSMAIAEAERVLARYGEAAAEMERALVHPAIKGQLRWEAEIYKRKGDLCKSLKQSAEGKAALEQALDRYRQLGDRAEVSHVLNNIGNIHYVAGELELALDSYKEALELQRALHRDRDVASTLNNIGGLLVLRSEYDSAMAHLTEAVKIKRTLDDPEELARSLNNLSVAYVETGRYGEASEVLGESYRLNVDTGKTGEQLFNLENMANVAMARGEWTSAIDYCESGLKLCLDSDTPTSRMPFLLVTSGVAMAQGNYDLVTGTIREVERVGKRLEDPDLSLWQGLFQAEWACCLGRVGDASKRAGGIVGRAHEEGLPSWLTRGYLLQARILFLQAETKKDARRPLRLALELAERIGALPEQIRARTMLSVLDTDENQTDLASEHLHQVERLVLACGAKPLFLPLSNALGRYYRRRSDLEMALSAFETARKLATNLALPDWTWRFLAQSGHVLVEMRRFDDATGHFRGCYEILSHLASKLPESHRDTYMLEEEKVALEDGVKLCHQAVMGIKN
jgi:tetratricopeptide (TPR) repeat protein